MKALVVIVLTVLFLASFLLYKASKALPLHELRRRARGGHDKPAQKIYKMAAYGPSLDLLLWLAGSLSAAGLLVLAIGHSRPLAGLVVLLLGWLFVFGEVNSDGWSWRLAAIVAPLATQSLSVAEPALNIPARWSKKGTTEPHTKVFEKEDLLALLDKQNRQADNRLSPAEINIVAGALTFGDKTVGSVMTPRRDVKLVAASDSIGPHLMDELHESGLGRFPVVKELNRSDKPEIIGTLYLKDIVGHPHKGKVRDVMKKAVYFINEEQNLRQALGTLLSNQHHLLVVVNNFEEFVGVLSLEALMEQILGEKISDEFEQNDSSPTVAQQTQTEFSEQEIVE